MGRRCMLTQGEIERIISVFKRLNTVEREDLLGMGESWIALRKPQLHVISGGISSVNRPRVRVPGHSTHGGEHPSANLVVNLLKQVK